MAEVNVELDLNDNDIVEMNKSEGVRASMNGNKFVVEQVKKEEVSTNENVSKDKLAHLANQGNIVVRNPLFAIRERKIGPVTPDDTINDELSSNSLHLNDHNSSSYAVRERWNISNLEDATCNDFNLLNESEASSPTSYSKSPITSSLVSPISSSKKMCTCTEAEMSEHCLRKYPSSI